MSICDAIANKKIITFMYIHNDNSGYRTVEPYQIGYNDIGHKALSAWFLSGTSESDAGPGWREYLIDNISDVTITEDSFTGDRDEYVEGRNGLLDNIECDI
jgi:predicted DNA-binding transcriptional regulator YafY